MQLFAYQNTMRNARPKEEISDQQVIRARVEAGRLLQSAKVEMRAATNEAELIVLKAQVKADGIIADALKRASQILGAVGLEERGAEKPPVIDLIRSVADKHGVTVAAIKGYARDASIAAIRHEAMALAYTIRSDLSLPQIGRIFNRDHTTILWAVKKLGATRQAGTQAA